MALRVVVLALMLLASVAVADDKPWAKDVPQEKQDAAFKKYDEANNLFAQGEYTKALEKYDEAVGLWDHPGIRYNRAVCLINLDRPVEAFKDLTEALKYGEEPLGKDLYSQGINYQKLLSKQVAEVEITTKEKGAKISLDGKPLTLVDGHATTMVAVNNPHEVIASKPGYQTNRHPLEKLPAGQKTTIEIKLQPLEGGRWKPWVAIAGGVAFVGTGGYFLRAARADNRAYLDAIEVKCPCVDENALGSDKDLPSKWRREEIFSYSAFAVGAVAVATGVWLFVRRGHHTTVAPAVSRESAGVSLVGSF